MPINLSGSLVLTGSLTATSTITAQTLVVQTITSSIVQMTGSNVFGSTLANTQVFTGSLLVSGSTHSIYGNTGFGTTSPNYTTAGRTVVAVNGTTSSLYALQNSGTSSGYVYGDASSVVLWAEGSRNVSVGVAGTGTVSLLTNNTSRLYITSGGNVGIGTTNPQGTFHIGGALASSGDAAAITLKQSSTTPTTGIYLERSGEQKGYYIYLGGSTDNLTFQRNNAGTKSDVMSLTRDGSVGIGTTNIGTEANLHLGAFSANEGGQLILQRATSYASASHLDNYQNRFRVLSGNDTGSTAERLSLNMANGDLFVYGSSYLGTNIIMSNSSGANSGQAAQVVSQEFGGTSFAVNLATLLPNFTFSSRALSVVMHVLGVSDSSNGTSVLINGYRASNGTWVINTVSTSQNGSTGVSGVSGSGTTITVTFNTFAFGVAYITVINRA